MRYTVLISLLMMLIHTISAAETTNNLVSQDFTTGWTGTNLSTNHGNGTIAGVDGQYIESDSVSLNTDVGLNKPTINEGFTITGSSNIWFWNSYSQSVTQTIKTVDDNGNIITQNRIISGVQNGYQTYSDKLIISSNTQSDYEINLRYDFSVPGTTGHYGADLKDPSLTVEYTFKEELDTTTESNLIALADTIEDDVYFEEVKFDNKVEEKFTFDEPTMDTLKEEDKLEEPAFEEFDMVEDNKEEEEPIMDTMEMLTEEENEKEEESNSETTESSNAEDEGDTQQEKSVQQKETKTARLEGILEKIDQDVKDIDKNLQLKNLVKLKVMSSNNLLEAYNIPFYEPKIIYQDQINIQDDRIIYPVDLVEYKQNDPIYQKRQRINTILQERQNLLNEIQVLQNG